MELSPITGQGFNRTEPQPDALAYLVNLFLREVLEVAVGGHDSGNPIGVFIKKGPGHAVNSATTHNTDSGVVVQSMCMSNNAMRGNT